jgi:hypothetical protein
MKTKKYLFVLIGLMVFNACEDQLDIPQQGVLNMQTYYQTPQEAQEALAALYSTWANTIVNNDYFCKNILVDDLYSGGYGPSDGQDFAPMSRAFYEANTGAINTLYKNLYATIYNANLILNAFDANDPNPVIKQAVAEARFFRAYCYLELVTLWGNPPLVTRVLSSDEAKVPNTPAADTWRFIEEELTLAINSGALTEKQNVNDLQAGVRPTKQTAQAYLGKTYLYQGKYGEALAQFKLVIGAQKYELAQNDDYRNLFHKEGNYSPEYLLSNNTVYGYDPATTRWVPFTMAIMINWIWGNPNLLIRDPLTCGGFFGMTYDMITGGVVPNIDNTLGWGFFNPTGKLYRAMRDIEGDAGFRLRNTLITHDRMHTEVGIWLENSEHFEHEGYYRLKFLARRSDAYPFTPFVGAAINFPAMRYAEVLLMAAEAGFKTNDPAAVGYFNEVRTRAQAPTVSALTMELIQNEFFVETAFEGHRFQDLQRWDKHGDIDMVNVLRDKGKKNVFFSTIAPAATDLYPKQKTDFTHNSWLYYVPAVEARAGFEAYEKLLPYPQTELDVNPNIVQNPGWEKVQ